MESRCNNTKKSKCFAFTDTIKMALSSMRRKRQRNFKILLERETRHSVTVLNPAVSRYKITNRGQSNHICYTIGNQMNRSQDFRPLKASFKVNATRTRGQFVAGSSSQLPKVFPSSHSKESIFSLVKIYKARTTVTGHVPVSYTHLRAHETSLHLVCRLLLEKK